ncbi:hypothetical protein HGP14_34195 [Rhizobium sp. P32RR-XVIII]|nr:hypothetical protein [Rhizobium sp. P32RR-XVIII]
MQHLFLVEAEKYGAFPLDHSVLERALAPRPSATAGRILFSYAGEVSGLDPSNAPNILSKSYIITAHVDIGPSEGGAFGGYGLYPIRRQRQRLSRAVQVHRQYRQAYGRIEIG